MGFLSVVCTNPVFTWLGVAVILLVIEIITINLVTIWFAVGALAALTVAYFGGGPVFQLVAFIVVSVILLIFTKPLLKKYVKKVPTNADALIGKNAVVTENIDNIEAKGQVKINGMTWSARSDDDVPIEKDSFVEILRIEGVKLIVKKKGKCE